MSDSLQILLNRAREDHLAITKEYLRILKLQKLLGAEQAPEWSNEQASRLLLARKKHYALLRMLNKGES